MRDEVVTAAASIPLSTARGDQRGALSLYLELAKARLSALVLATTAVGFVLAAGDNLDWLRLACTLVGTLLAAFGANALNQCVEVDRDARMPRTAGRPLPARRLTRTCAWAFALATAVVGPILLWSCVNGLTAGLALLCELIYVLAYTPLKVRSTLNTLVGAICGAIPPLMGWSAATGQLPTTAWGLGALVFVWQIPHFLALAWLYRTEYAGAGFRMLPVLDPTGRLTGQMTVLYALALLPVGLGVTLTGSAGAVYGIGSLLLGAGLLALAVRFDRDRTEANARRVFLASVIYLPLLLGLMLLDRTPAGRRISTVDGPVVVLARVALATGDPFDGGGDGR